MAPILYPKCNVRDISVTNLCRLQLLARLVGCRRRCPFPPPIRVPIETLILLHSRGLPAERRHRGRSGTPSRVVACRARPRSWRRRDSARPPPMHLLGRCPWRDRRADVPATRRFPARPAALRLGWTSRAACKVASIRSFSRPIAASKKCLLDRKEKRASSGLIVWPSVRASSMLSGSGISVDQTRDHLIDCGFDSVQLGLFVALLQDADGIGECDLGESILAPARSLQR